jgi:hypothetical protein
MVGMEESGTVCWNCNKMLPKLPSVVPILTGLARAVEGVNNPLFAATGMTIRTTRNARIFLVHLWRRERGIPIFQIPIPINQSFDIV